MTRLARSALLGLMLLLLAGCTSQPEFVYKSDQELYGVREKWTYPLEKDGVLYGDCEDYAIYWIETKGHGVVGIVPMAGGTHHAVAIIDGYVYDQHYAYPIKLTDYPRVITKHRKWKDYGP